ncbi:hypothetical protein K5549_021445, partial [Capra hircus]
LCGVPLASLLESLARASLAVVCSTSMAPAGFIGLGKWGIPCGVPFLVIYDVFPDACREFLDASEQVVSSPADVAGKDGIITMLPTSINSWTRLKRLSNLAKEVEKMGGCPVSGGVEAAQSGNLTFTAGSRWVAQELLGSKDSSACYCGARGPGQALRICYNILLAIGMTETADAMNLGKRLGPDPKLLAKILNVSSGHAAYNPISGVIDGVPFPNNYQGGFRTTLMVKDLGLAQDSNVSTNTPIFLGSQVHQIYARYMKFKKKKIFFKFYQFIASNPSPSTLMHACSVM